MAPWCTWIGRRRKQSLRPPAYHDLVWRLVEVGNAMSVAVATHSSEVQDASGYLCSELSRRMSSVFLPLLQLLLGEFIQDGRRKGQRGWSVDEEDGRRRAEKGWSIGAEEEWSRGETEGGVSVRKRDGEAARLYLLGRCGQQWMIRYIWIVHLHLLPAWR